MRKIFRTVDVGVELTPAELARCFCEMDSEEQSAFFNEIGKETDLWKVSFVFQLQAITDCVILNDKGRNIMRQIGQYADKNKEVV